MAQIIKKTIERGGKILIPVLAVGRAQEIQLVIENLMRNEQIPSVPIFLEGMITEATAITTYHPEYLSRQIRERVFKENDNPFTSSFFIK